MPSFNDAPKTATENIQPELETIHQRLSKCNSEYISLLQQAEDKLHKIVNKRTPEGSVKEQAIPSPNDFVSAAHQELSAYESYNTYLSKLLSHLSQIA